MYLLDFKGMLGNFAFNSKKGANLEDLHLQKVKSYKKDENFAGLFCTEFLY